MKYGEYMVLFYQTGNPSWNVFSTMDECLQFVEARDIKDFYRIVKVQEYFEVKQGLVPIKGDWPTIY